MPHGLREEPHLIRMECFGANVNSQNNHRLTPLHYAVPNESLPAMTSLINVGAELEFVDEDVMMPLLEIIHNKSALT